MSGARKGPKSGGGARQTTLFQTWGYPAEDEDEEDRLLVSAVEAVEESSSGLRAATRPHNVSGGGACHRAAAAAQGFDREAGHSWIYPTNYPERKYQLDIVRACLFQNTLVSLPTGLGKTFIAAVVMYNFFRWYPQGKVVFMAPTKPLVAQQIEACFNIMGIDQSETAEMTGNVSVNVRERAWQSKRVFFLTPQVMSNDLSRGLFPSQQVKLLVVDEAHRAQGDYAYCQVVKELKRCGTEFRVVALSATPGTDLLAVRLVLQNLLISHVELRHEESPDIIPYTFKRMIEKVVVPVGDELKEFQKRFVSILEIYIKRLSKAGGLTRRGNSVNPLHYSKFGLLQARNEFRQNPPASVLASGNSRGLVEVDFASAITLYHAHELLMQHGMRTFYNFVSKTIEGSAANNSLTGTDQRGSPYQQQQVSPGVNRRLRYELTNMPTWRDMYDQLKAKFVGDANNSRLNCSIRPQQPSQFGNTLTSAPQASQDQHGFVVGHPKLARLRDMVLGHFRNKQAEGVATRAMIFSQYRDSVQEITACLHAHRPLIKAMEFVGHSGTKGKKGLSQKEQLEVVRRFRDGGYNTLVATCVGEEGLDIGEIDLIVCYDVSKSPIRLVQRMGRTGRKREGRIIVLVTEGKEEQTYNQSVYSRNSIKKAILEKSKLENYFCRAPRMIPEDMGEPVCQKMTMRVGTFLSSRSDPKVSSRRSVGDKKISDLITAAGGSSASKVAASSSSPSVAQLQYLSEEELEYWKVNFRVQGPEPPRLEPRKEMWALSPASIRTRVLESLHRLIDQMNNDATTFEKYLDLGDWTLWQDERQKRTFVSQSSTALLYEKALMPPKAPGGDEAIPRPAVSSSKIASAEFEHELDREFENLSDVEVLDPKCCKDDGNDNELISRLMVCPTILNIGKLRPPPVFADLQARLTLVSNNNKDVLANFNFMDCWKRLGSSFKAIETDQGLLSPPKPDMVTSTPLPKKRSTSPTIDQPDSFRTTPSTHHKNPLASKSSSKRLLLHEEPSTLASPIVRFKSHSFAPDQDIVGLDFELSHWSQPHPSGVTQVSKSIYSATQLVSIMGRAADDSLRDRSVNKQQISTTVERKVLAENEIPCSGKASHDTLKTITYPRCHVVHNNLDDLMKCMVLTRSTLSPLLASSFRMKIPDESCWNHTLELDTLTTDPQKFKVPELQVFEEMKRLEAKIMAGTPPGRRKPERNQERSGGGGLGTVQASNDCSLECPIADTQQVLGPTRKRNRVLLSSSSEEDNEEVPDSPLPVRTAKRLRRRKLSRSVANFLDLEAGVSSDEGAADHSHDDHEESNCDAYEASFVDDSSMNVSPDQRAMYLRSVKDLPSHWPRRRIESRASKPMRREDIYSQLPDEDDVDEYELDSFVVDGSTTALTEANSSKDDVEIIKEIPRKSDKGPARRKRLMRLDASSSSSSNEDEPVVDVGTGCGSRAIAGVAASTNLPCPSRSAPSLLGLSQRVKSMTNLVPPLPPPASSSSSPLVKTPPAAHPVAKAPPLRGGQQGKFVANDSRSSSGGSSNPGVSPGGISPGLVGASPGLAGASPKVGGNFSVLVSASEINRSQELVSVLRHRHGLTVSFIRAAATGPDMGADYLLSPRVGVCRIMSQEFCNAANRSELLRKCQTLNDQFERPCILVEEEGRPPASAKGTSGPHGEDVVVISNHRLTPSHRPRTKYLDRVLALLSQCKVRLLFSDSQASSADLMAALIRMEARKGQRFRENLRVDRRLERVLPFYRSLPGVGLGAALAMATSYPTPKDFVKSAQVTMIRKSGLDAVKVGKIQAFLVGRKSKGAMVS